MDLDALPSGLPLHPLTLALLNADEDRLYLQLLGTFKDDGVEMKQFAGTYFSHTFHTTSFEFV